MAEAMKQISTAPTTGTPQRLPASIWSRWSVRLLFYALLIALWQLLCSRNIWPPAQLPGPLDVLRALISGFQSGIFLKSALASLGRLALGYTLSLLIGPALGLLIARVSLLKETIGSFILGLQALPSICWLPLAILWFGLNEQAILFVVVMGALFPITLNVELGVRNILPIHLKAARNLGTHGLALYTQVILPAAFPTILNGLKQGWTFAWRSLMAGELIYNTLSLGNLLATARNTQRPAQMIAVMLLIIIIGVTIDALIFAPLERVTRSRWGLAG